MKLEILENAVGSHEIEEYGVKIRHEDKGLDTQQPSYQRDKKVRKPKTTKHPGRGKTGMYQLKEERQWHTL